MPTDHKEIAFEESIEAELLEAGGYEQGDARNFDAERGLDPLTFLWFVRDSQPQTWQALEDLHGDGASGILIDHLCKALDGPTGSLGVLRHGFKCFGKRVYAAFFQPAHGMNPETDRLFEKNRLTVTRQVHHSPKQPNQSLDLVLSVNGIPVATAELKNPLTGQNVGHARKQYENDRDPRDPIFEFKKRALVHFAVDPDEVYMATSLAGSKTYWLPFNRGNGTAAGNPPNPHGYRTEYLWKEVWQRDSWMDILARFIHLQIDEKVVGGKTVHKETMIFPRYHQLSVVRKLEADARQVGAGKNYLIQHSAGSGKSNSIAWLAHRLASLHNEQDEKVFSSVVVITDRVVLDGQLQDTIYQFEHRQGVVQKIDEDSAQLAAALKAEAPIIITTLQKFPFVTDKIEDIPDHNYAVIVDEAHSSQSGESAADLKGVLSGHRIREEARQEAEEQGLAEHEEMLLREMARRGQQPNLSFFAFTATPKYKTLEVFGQPGPGDKPIPFHLYSMRQAIEEGFILDVLKSYVTYETYYRLLKRSEDDPSVVQRKAARALARFMSLHPHNIAQKAEVMLEHFRTHTRHEIGGKAKAMVVTGSRLHAVRYKQEFDRQIREKGYSDLHTLVAFSGTVKDPDAEDVTYTEPDMNIDVRPPHKPIREKELPQRFADPDYHVLIVADKYQTGFDQPLLHTMFVDKRLAGIQAVQTLSRLNRTHPGKDSTFVLDFMNQREEVFEAFQAYYEVTGVGEQADSAQLSVLYDELMDRQIIWREEVEKLCEAFFRAPSRSRKDDHSRLYVFTDPAIGRFELLDDEKQDEFRAKVLSFRNLYSFLSQIIPFHDSDYEKLYTFLRFFIRRLPRKDTGPNYEFGDDIALEFYKLRKIAEGAIELQPSNPGELDGPTEVGTGKGQGPEIELSELIEILNRKFGTEFSPADQLFFDQVQAEAAAREDLQQAAQANTLENFTYVFKKLVEGLFIDRLDQNEELVARYMNNNQLRGAVDDHLAKAVYSQIREKDASTAG